jgi:prepilin-type N-terminal cleavage/methylation domain-containing protein
MRGGSQGFTLVEMIVAVAILGIIMGVASAFLAQQSRAAGISQAINEAELAARTIAEAVIQDFQLAGSRAYLDVGGVARYVNIQAGGCDAAARHACVVPHVMADGGAIQLFDPASVNGYTIYYLTSLEPAAPCRRVDYALLESTMYRSDVGSTTCAPLLSLGQIDLDVAAFASNVSDFSVAFECSGAVVVDGESTTRVDLPSQCYGSGEYLRQAVVDVTVQLTGRYPVASQMTMTAFMPNLRPSVSYLGE